MGPRLAAVLAAAASALGAQTFVDVTVAAGLSAAQQLPPYDPFAEPYASANHHGGVAVGDVDGDGWEDIYWHGGSWGFNRLYRNLGDGTFVNVAFTSGVAIIAPSADASFADTDDDGDLDLFITTYENYPFGGGPVIPRNFLFRNDSAGGTIAFTDVTVAAGLVVSGRSGAAWGDLDGDHDVDLVTVSWRPTDPTFVFRNNGNGTFTDVTPANLANDDIRGFAPTLVDFDEDGDLDVLTTGDFVTSRVYRNDGAFVFTDVTQTVVDGGPLDDENGMGSAFADVDGDGRVDWFVSSIYIPPEIPPPGNLGPKTGNRLWRSNGDGTFSDITESSGVRIGGWGWGSAFGDLDNDGDADLIGGNGSFIGTSELIPWIVEDPLKLFVNDGTGVFTESAAELGLVHVAQDRGVSLFDYDHDGRLDVLVSAYGTGLSLYRNELVLPDEWLHVELRGRVANRRGLGAKVEVTSETSTQTAWMLGSNHYVSSGPDALWFGIPGAPVVDLTVTWPSGNVTEMVGVATGARIVVDEALPWDDLGFPLAGTGGISPLLEGSGELTAGVVTTLALSAMPPGGSGVLVVGLTSIYAPFKGGVLVPQPLVTLPVFANGAGAFTLAFAWPAGAPDVPALFVQTLVPDAGAPKGFAFSNAIGYVAP